MKHLRLHCVSKKVPTFLQVLYMLSPARLSSVWKGSVASVCNARASYSAGWNFLQYFYGIW